MTPSWVNYAISLRETFNLKSLVAALLPLMSPNLKKAKASEEVRHHAVAGVGEREAAEAANDEPML